jgi:nucleotide-binding universal stress UspA family protein
MTYAAVLVHAQADAEVAPRLSCARAVADMFNATLIGLAAELNPPVLPGGGGAVVLGGAYARAQASWIGGGIEEVETSLLEARKAFQHAVSGRSGEVLWEAHVELPVPAMARIAGTADLIVASDVLGRRPNPYRDASPAELALTAGRPVLVAAKAAKPLSADKVVLAWKNTREARRAMADALPFLTRASEVLVLAVCEKDGLAEAENSTANIATALGRHGVAATAKAVVHHPADGHEILHQASLFGADLIVAGAYGHSRLQERVFGGVTRQLLDQDDVYLLLSH